MREKERTSEEKKEGVGREGKRGKVEMMAVGTEGPWGPSEYHRGLRDSTVLHKRELREKKGGGREMDGGKDTWEAAKQRSQQTHCQLHCESDFLKNMCF